MTLDLAAEQKHLEETEAQVRYLTVAALRPELSPEKAEAYRQLERSARAEASLRRKGLAHARQVLGNQGSTPKFQSSPPG